MKKFENTFADKVINFNQKLKYTGKLPEGISVLNPFIDNNETLVVMSQFYKKYYNDNKNRKFIIGINPSRHGAGVTGVPFTDTKRLDNICGIKMLTAHTHEVSSVFIYDMIEEYGGTDKFYSNYYINSPFPLAIVRDSGGGKFLNANYYDFEDLFLCVEDFMIDSLKKHIEIGLNTDEVYILGKKNAEFISRINDKTMLFNSIKVLDHPRYIQQYKSKEKNLYIDKYLSILK